ncbi:MAG: hypothetical protein RR531_13640, partial [Longicatena sp.]
LKIKQIEDNKAQEEYVSVYLVNKESNKLAEIPQKVAVMTNEEPKHFLTDLLKKVPNENYYSSISGEAIINNIFLLFLSLL